MITSSLHTFLEQLPLYMRRSRLSQGRSALIAIDVQPDFMPGGPLACADGNAIVSPLNALLALSLFDYVVATQDWHPSHHVSFASQHEGRQPFDTASLYGHQQTLWPDHCVMNTPGAALHHEVDWQCIDITLRKGTDPSIDAYSAFRHNLNQQGERPSTGLTGWLRDLGVTDVYLCGLARDVCVLWSAQDAADAGFNACLLWPLTRPVSYTTNEATLETLGKAGVTVLGHDIGQ